MKLKVYLGTSGAGKTTLIEKTYDLTDMKDVTIRNMRCCSGGHNLFLGWYKIAARCRGCDTLSMTIIDELIKFLDKQIKDNVFETIVMDGDRVNNMKMLLFLEQHKDKVEIIFVNTSLDTIYKRRPDCNKVFVQTTQTKTHNMISEYKKRGFKVTTIDEEKQGWF